MIRRLIPAVLLVAIAVVLLVVAWPQLFHAERLPLVAQAVSLRPLAIVGAVVAIVLLGFLAALASGMRRFAASVVVLLIAFCFINGAVLSSRGFGDTAFETANDADVTVLTWNTLGDAPGAELIAELALDEGADVITLPETTLQLGTAVAERMGREGHPMYVFTEAFDQISKARSTTLLVSDSLGEYRKVTDRGSTGQLPSVIAEPVDGTGPTFVAVHPVAPIAAELGRWSSDLDWLATACGGENVIMAGDFNSTIDHFAHVEHATGKTIGNCTDAAQLSGNGAVGTWPTKLPSALGTPIDHVMLTDNWRVSGMRVIDSLDDAGSDHRPIVAQLSPVD